MSPGFMPLKELVGIIVWFCSLIGKPIKNNSCIGKNYYIPVAEYYIPVVEHHIPVVEHYIPIAEHDIPVAEHNIPAAEH